MKHLIPFVFPCFLLIVFACSQDLSKSLSATSGLVTTSIQSARTHIANAEALIPATQPAQKELAAADTDLANAGGDETKLATIINKQTAQLKAVQNSWGYKLENDIKWIVGIFAGIIILGLICSFAGGFAGFAFLGTIATVIFSILTGGINLILKWINSFHVSRTAAIKTKVNQPLV